MTRNWRRGIVGSTLATLLLPAVVAAQDGGVTLKESSRIKGFLQGGMYLCCPSDGTGFVFGGGVAISPLSNAGARIFLDGHTFDGMAFNGSATIAYEGGDAEDRGAWHLGAGWGSSGPQLVVGLGRKAGLFQYRAILSNYYSVHLLLAGVRFGRLW